MTPIPLSKLSANSENNSPGDNSDFLDDSNSQGADDIQKRFGWPNVECVVSINYLFIYLPNCFQKIYLYSKYILKCILFLFRKFDSM